MQRPTGSESGHGIWLKGHGWNLEHERGGHRGAGGIATDTKDGVGLEVADQSPAGENAARQIDEGTQTHQERNVLKLAYLDQVELESSVGDEAALHAACSAHEENFCCVTRDQFASHRERGNDVTAGASAGNKYAQVRQASSSRKVMLTVSQIGRLSIESLDTKLAQMVIQMFIHQN
jgi:hypothetical protein